MKQSQLTHILRIHILSGWGKFWEISGANTNAWTQLFWLLCMQYTIKIYLRPVGWELNFFLYSVTRKESIISLYDRKEEWSKKYSQITLNKMNQNALPLLYSCSSNYLFPLFQTSVTYDSHTNRCFYIVHILKLWTDTFSGLLVLFRSLKESYYVRRGSLCVHHPNGIIIMRRWWSNGYY